MGIVGCWVLFLAAVTPMMHNFWTVTDPMMHQMQFVMFMKNLSMLGAALFHHATAPARGALTRAGNNWRVKVSMRP